MRCEEVGCRAEVIIENTWCLAHATAGSRQDFLTAVAEAGRGLHDALRHLEIGAELFEELRPVLHQIDEYVDFTGALFPDSVDFGELCLVKRATFNGASFRGDVRFSGVTFAEAARFNGASFHGLAVFGSNAPYYSFGRFRGHPEGAVFEGTVEFIGAQFHDDARFDCVSFQGDVNFERAVFHGELHQERMQDLSESLAQGAGIDRTISFHRTHFGGGAVIVLPVGHVLAAQMEIGAASRIVIRGPLTLDQITLNHPLTVLTAGRGEVDRLRSEGCPPDLEALTGARLQAPLIVGNGVSLERCAFSGAVGLEQLSLQAGTAALREHRGRRVLLDEIMWRQEDDRRGHRLADRVAPVTWAEVASLAPLPKLGRPDPGAIAARYRQLRQGLEEARNAPGAADFYYGEMEMRRASSRSPYERFFLWLYWIVSGYGLRASRSMATYLGVLVATTALFRYGSETFLDACRAGEVCPELDQWWETLMFVARWSVSFFPSPEVAGVSTAGQAVLLVLRFVSPALIALTVFALRARVHR